MHHDLTRRRRLVTAAFITAAAVLVGVLLLLVGVVVGPGWWLGLLGAIVGGATAWFLLRRTPERVLASVGAVPLADAPRLENLVDGLCVANGIPHPSLHVVEIAACNAAALGLSERHGALVVTRGALDRLSRIELEAVVARELALIKSGHTGLATDLAAICWLWSGAAERLLPPRADVVADLEAVSLTRYPPGLLEALAKVHHDPSVPGAPRWTRHLWIEDPVEPAHGRAGSIHSPIEERIATLREL